MADSITIQGIAVKTKIGVPEQERATAQTLRVSVELFLDLSRTGKSDNVEESINYQSVFDDVHSLAQSERKTVECFAQDIADHILKKYKPKSVKVSVEKKALPNTSGVFVTILRP